MDTTTTLRVGVIGLGVGRTHIRAYQSVPGVEVLAIADVAQDARDRARQEFGIPSVFSDYRALLEYAEIDAVSICTPDRLHAEQALRALEAGKHVLCEKPMTTTLEEAAQVVRKVSETGLTFMMCHNYRFIPQFARLKQLADSGAVGKLFYADSSYIQDLYFMDSLGPEYWRFKDPQDLYLGGAVHNVDLARWICGEIVEVHAYSNHMWPAYPIDENYVSNFRFANGCIGRVLLILGTKLKDKFLVDLNVYGGEGALRAIMQRPEVIYNADQLGGDCPAAIPVREASSHTLAISEFVACILERRRPMLDVMEGAKAVAVCLAAIQSAREGKSVAVSTAYL
jgi:predicted dehydrogenase